MQRFINPTPFDINIGIEYLFMAVVGGAGIVWGAVLGAALITLLKELLQAIAAAPARPVSGHFEIIVFGVLIVILLHHAATASGRWSQRLLPRAAAPARRSGVDACAAARRSCRRAARPLLAVREARKQFGGLVAVNDGSAST